MTDPKAPGMPGKKRTEWVVTVRGELSQTYRFYASDEVEASARALEMFTSDYNVERAEVDVAEDFGWEEPEDGDER